MSNIKKIFALSSAIVLSSSLISPSIQASTSSYSEDLSHYNTEYGFDNEGNKLFATKYSEGSVETAIVTDETGKEVAKFSLDTKKNEAFLNDKKLTSEEFNNIKSLALEPNNNNFQVSNKKNIQGFSAAAATSKVTYKYAGTHNGSLWVIKGAAAAAASVLLVIVPGINWKMAIAAANGIIGVTGTVYYSMSISYGYSPGYVHVKRSITFYKNSARTQKLYGPMVSYQKKSDQY